MNQTRIGFGAHNLAAWAEANLRPILATDQKDTDADGRGDVCAPLPGTTAGKVPGAGYVNFCH